MPPNDNGNIGWIKIIFAGLLVIAIAVFGFISTNKASVDSVKGLDARVQLMEKAIPEIQQDIKQILINTKK